MNSYKNDFPLLKQLIHGKPLVYLDNSATSQKPAQVIEAIQQYYQHDNANVHRGVYELSQRATVAFEKTRTHIQTLIHAAHAHEIIFTRGTTESINLVAQSFGRTYFKVGDEVIISAMEHHANIVPWQLLEAQCGILLKIIPISDAGEIDLEAYQQLFSKRTKLVALSHASNVLGTINPIKIMIAIAHTRQVPVLIDGAQAMPHMAIDMQDLDCDFYAFSAHKAYGPTSLGVLYGKEKWLNDMPPYQGGGNMIESVTFEKTVFQQLPYKFEAGTPSIAEVISFNSALDYLDKIGMKAITEHEQQLLTYATAQLATIPELKIIGTAKEKVGVISFVLDAIHPHDIATVLDHQGIAVRAGHHCAMPLMLRFHIPACTRISFGIYNTCEDIDAFIKGLHIVKRLFQ